MKDKPKAKKFDPSKESLSWGAIDLGAALVAHNKKFNEGIEATQEVKYEMREKVRK